MAKERETQQQNNDYSAKNLEVLEGLEAVRVRPGMYIGSTGVKGLHHILWEIVDNAVDANSKNTHISFFKLILPLNLFDFKNAVIDS